MRNLGPDQKTLCCLLRIERRYGVEKSVSEKVRGRRGDLAVEQQQVKSRIHTFWGNQRRLLKLFARGRHHVVTHLEIDDAFAVLGFYFFDQSLGGVNLN